MVSTDSKLSDLIDTSLYTLEELSKNLSNLSSLSNDSPFTLKNCSKILHSYSSTGTDYMSYIKFNENGYQRIKLPQSTDQFDLVLICWNKNQETKIHNHPEKGCLMIVLQGELTEKVYDVVHIAHIDNADVSATANTPTPVGSVSLKYSQNLQAGLVSFRQGSKDVHKISNGDEKSVSLHIYSPPNHIPTFYHNA